MFEKNFESVIGVDTDHAEIHFYTAKNGDKNSISYFAANCRAQLLNDDFFEKLASAIEKYREGHPDVSLQKVSLVLPDSAVVTDTINLPIINKKAMDTSLEASLTNLYGAGSIKFNRLLASQNKQFATYAVSGVRKEILVKLQDAFSSHSISVANVTFAAAATTNAAITLNPKFKNASFVLLDLKEDYARIVFTVGGKTLGFYSLPFGENVLHLSDVAPEDMLFDHPSAELLVLNAREKAKAKALTRAESLMNLQVSDEEEDAAADPTVQPQAAAPAPSEAADDEDDEDDGTPVEAFVLRGKLRKKTPRSLPKYMQREIPTEEKGVAFENFRVFVKWTLELIASNAGITALGAPEAVYVNMSERYSYLFDMVNAESEENGILFLPLPGGRNEAVRKNLDLYGAFFVRQLNRFNNFHATQLDSFKTKKQSASEKPGDKSKESAASFSEKMQKVWEFIKKIANTEIGGKR